MNRKHFKIIDAECLVIGDLNVDMILNNLDRFPEIDSEILCSNYEIVIGGSGGIFSSVLSMLGIKTAIASKIGNDIFGKFLANELEKKNVEIGLIKIDHSKKTGITLNLSYENGKSQISSVDIIKEFKIEDVCLKNLDKIRHVHFPSYYLMDNLRNGYIELIKTIKSRYKEITFSMDTNDDPSDKWDEEIYNIFPFIDILFLNKKEALCITHEENIKKSIKILNKYIKKIIIKSGIDGYHALIDDKYFRGFCNNKINKNFIDSTGAGDNFDAAFIFGFLNNFKFEDILRFANFCAEKSIEYIGGVGTGEKYKFIKNNFSFKDM